MLIWVADLDPDPVRKCSFYVCLYTEYFKLYEITQLMSKKDLMTTDLRGKFYTVLCVHTKSRSGSDQKLSDLDLSEFVYEANKCFKYHKRERERVN